MNFYEHTLVAKQDLSVAQIDEVKNKYNDIINNTSGKVMKIESWGFLNFARKINNYNKGIQVIIFSATILRDSGFATLVPPYFCTIKLIRNILMNYLKI